MEQFLIILFFGVCALVFIALIVILPEFETEASIAEKKAEDLFTN